MDSDVLSNIQHPTLTYPKKRDSDVRAFFRRFAQALANRDSETFASLWAKPSLVLSDHDSQTTSSLNEFRRLLDEAGFLTEPSIEIQRVDWTTDRTALATVRIGREPTTCVIRYDRQGNLKLHFALVPGTKGRSE